MLRRDFVRGSARRIARNRVSSMSSRLTCPDVASGKPLQACGRTQIRADTLTLLAALAERRAAGQGSDRMARVRRWLGEVLAEYRRHRGELPRPVGDRCCPGRRGRHLGDTPVGSGRYGLATGPDQAADRGRAVHASEGCIKPGTLQLRNASVVRPVSGTRAGRRMAATAVPRTPGLVDRLIHRRDVS